LRSQISEVFEQHPVNEDVTTAHFLQEYQSGAVVEEFDELAVPVLQRPRQLRSCGGRTQDGRNNRAFPLYELAEKRPNLLVLPGADSAVADKNRC
jgi:hypothetical protein